MKFSVNSILKTFLFFFLSFLLGSENAFACPGKYGIQDYNCDGEVNLFFIGDSFVHGTGDTTNKGKGGYILRLKKSLKDINVYSYSVPGLRAITLLGKVNDVYKDDLFPSFRKNLTKADVIVLDLGRNDRWLMGLPGKTYRDLSKIAKLITKIVNKDTGYDPLVIQAVLMLPNRGAQGPWVKELNEIILAKDTDKYPSDLRFDLVSKRLIGEDQIHPMSKGYVALAKAFIEYLPDLSLHLKTNRPDTDLDGLNDVFETKKYLSDPLTADTDGDLKSDYDEVFTYFTNPLIAD